MNVKRDNNQVPVISGVLDTDGETPTNIFATPSTNVLDVADDTSGSDFGISNAKRGDSGVPGLIAVSESDGVTPVQLYVDSSGNLLIDST